MAHDHESIEYGLGEVKEVFNASVLTGTIVSVDTENDKADVDINGLGLINDVSIFYHCGGSSVIEGGSMAFEDGDSVYVLNKNGIINPSVSDLKIVGFVDGLKNCGFRFQLKLTRGDGTLITETSELLFYINIYGSDGLLLSSVATYNGETERWEVVGNVVDLGGYWIEYGCKDGIGTQYPYKYKTADKYDISDLILSGEYEDIIPHWKITDLDAPPCVDMMTFLNIDDYGSHCPPTGICSIDADFFAFVTTVRFGKKVQSSVPWKVTYEVDDYSIGYLATGRFFVSDPLDVCTTNALWAPPNPYQGNHSIVSDDGSVNEIRGVGYHNAIEVVGSWQSGDSNVYMDVTALGPDTQPGHPKEWVPGEGWEIRDEIWNFAYFAIDKASICSIKNISYE